MVSELIRFALAGAVGVVVDIAILQLYIRVVGDVFVRGDRLFLGQAIAWLAAVTSTWWLNRQFTFRAAPSEPKLRQWFQFVAVNSAGGIVNYLVYAALVAGVPFCRNFPASAVALSALAGMVLNFLGSRTLVFRRQTSQVRHQATPPDR